jgi:antitoxin MazE
MRTTIRKMGNSQGVLIPKALLAQTGIEQAADISVENGAIVLRKPRQNGRQGWADASKEIALLGDDALAWPDFANESDEEWQW